MAIEFTCCECGNTYNADTGDLDERMCTECLDKFYDDKEIKDEKQSGRN